MCGSNNTSIDNSNSYERRLRVQVFRLYSVLVCSTVTHSYVLFPTDHMAASHTAGVAMQCMIGSKVFTALPYQILLRTISPSVSVCARDISLI